MGALTDAAVELVRSHSAWAPPIVFALAFCESFAFVSLIVPATVLLLAIGGMVGASGIGFGFIWVAAAAGAIAGDWLAYELASWLKDRVTHTWPLSRHPLLVAKGFAFFRRWGIAAVFAGRFFGPLRAIVPIAAGVCGMSRTPFQIANVTSAAVWATAVLAPGIIGLRWWSGG